jgi:dihydrofolate reductase
VKQLTAARLVDVYQMVVVPVVLGKGRTMFDGLKDRVPLSLTESRSFGNGNVVLSYTPAT